MPRYKDIRDCFRKSIKQDSRGQQLVTTGDFIVELERRNWHWTLERANSWIENQTTCFTDITPDFSENRTYRLYNANGGL
jgi:hypothetical protein